MTYELCRKEGACKGMAFHQYLASLKKTFDRTNKQEAVFFQEPFEIEFIYVTPVAFWLVDWNHTIEDAWFLLDPPV